ncbi:hypothetical protein D3C71_2074680 [compost metagenome]
MGALGVAILARKSGKEKEFNFNVSEQDFLTKGTECNGCSNNCEIIKVYRDGKMIDRWGNRCERVRV